MMEIKPQVRRLTVELLTKEARNFAQAESTFPEPSIFGVTDGKKIGTYFEHKFRGYLHSRYEFTEGSSAKGIDFPELNVDMKVTSIRQPQSSCPYKDARQKIYGLGYSLLVFVYDKSDDSASGCGILNVLHTIYVDKERTADFQMTTNLRRIVENAGNLDDVVAYLLDKSLQVDDIKARDLGEEILRNPPEIGYLTISNWSAPRKLAQLE